MRIAINTWRRPLPTYLDPATDLYTLAAEYAQAISDEGATPLLLPHLEEAAVNEVLDVCHALVLSGGGDLVPSTYGGVSAGASRDVCPAADRSEVALVRAARARGMAVLGICRGMQVLNVACGGTLVEDIAVAGGHHEPIPDDPAAVMAARHPVSIKPDCRLAAVYGVLERDVNTIHHQAVDRLAEGFRVTARAPDGVVEGIEYAGDWLALGVQWHPEKSLADDRPLFTTFVRWVRESVLERAR